MRIIIIVSLIITVIGCNNNNSNEIKEIVAINTPIEAVDLDTSIRSRVYKLLGHYDESYISFEPELFGLPDSMRIDYALEVKYPTMYDNPNMGFRNVYESNRIEDITEGEIANSYNMYFFKFIGTNPQYVLLTNHGKLEIITVRDDGGYESLIKKIFKYFKDNPNIDERLLPLYVQELTKEYVVQKLGYSQDGPWRQWEDNTYDKVDSIGRIYNKYLDYR